MNVRSRAAILAGVSEEMFKLLVANEDRSVCSFGWRIWARSTSFYLKCTNQDFGLKLSLHGPDPRHSRPGFKFAFDGQSTASSSYVATSPGWLPAWFPGKDVVPEVRLAFRLRVPWEVFDQVGPQPPELAEGQEGFVITAPRAPHAADIDFYVSSAGPYWPNQAQATQDNALLGPLTNESNQHLTAVSYRRNVLATPTPPRALGRQPANLGDRIRGLGGTVDDDRVFWMVEQWLSRSALASGDHELMNTRRPAPYLGQGWRANQFKPSRLCNPFRKDTI